MKKSKTLIVLTCLPCLQAMAAPGQWDGRASYGYDSSGNMVRRESGRNAETFEFHGQRLSKVIRKDGSEDKVEYDRSGRITDAATGLKYEYGETLLPTKVTHADGKQDEIFHNAEGKIVGIRGAATGMEALIWDGERMIAKGSESTVFEADGKWGGSPVLTLGGNGADSPHICDFIGTSVYQNGESSGSGPFGEGKSGGFVTGKPYIREIGAYAFANRIYLPELAIWNSPDPSGFRDGHSRYSYLRNPFSQYDRLGLEPNWTGYGIYEDMDPKGTAGPETKVGWMDATWPAENFNIYLQELTYGRGRAFPSSGQRVTHTGGYTITLNFYNEVTWGDTFTFGSEYASVSSGTGGASGSGMGSEVSWEAAPEGHEDLVCAYPEKITSWKWQKRYNGMASGPGGAETGERSAWVNESTIYYDGEILKKGGRKEL